MARKQIRFSFCPNVCNDWVWVRRWAGRLFCMVHFVRIQSYEKFHGWVNNDVLTLSAWCVVVGYTMDTMYFTWLDKPVDVDKDLQLPQFFLVSTPKFDCSQNYTAGTHMIVFVIFIYIFKHKSYFLIEFLNKSLLY